MTRLAPSQKRRPELPPELDHWPPLLDEELETPVQFSVENMPSKHRLDATASTFPLLLNLYDYDPDNFDSRIKRQLDKWRDDRDAVETGLHLISKGVASEEQESDLIGLKERLDHNVTAYEWALRPFRTFPNELLLEIFEHLLAEQPISLGKQIHVTPFILSRVCSRWRKVVLGHPPFWSNINLYSPDWQWNILNPREKRQLDTNLFYLTTALQRSRTRPLSLHIEIEGQVQMKQLAPFLDPCIEAAGRIQSLTMRRVREELVAYINAYMERDLPQQLQHLDIEILTQPERFLNSFALAPKLARLTLGRFAVNTNSIPFPWTRITHLELRDVFDFRDLIRLCTQLESLTVDGWQISYDEGSPIQLGNLVELTLRVSSCLFQQHFLDHLVAPRLSIIRIGVDTPDAADPILQLGSLHLDELILRSSCSLTELSLLNVSVTELDWLLLVPKLGSLKRLEINECFVKPNVPYPIDLRLSIGLGVQSWHETVPLPLLEELSLSTRRTRSEGFPSDMIVFAITYRCSARTDNPPRIEGVKQPEYQRLKSVTLTVREDTFNDKELHSLRLHRMINQETKISLILLPVE